VEVVDSKGFDPCRESSPTHCLQLRSLVVSKFLRRLPARRRIVDVLAALWQPALAFASVPLCDGSIGTRMEAHLLIGLREAVGFLCRAFSWRMLVPRWLQ
jgi:hypothetical protein